MKVTKKLQQDLITFNRVYRKSNKERPLTIEEYIKYLYGKGLPSSLKKTKPKPLKPKGIPNWAHDPYQYPSVQNSNYIPLKKTDSFKQEVSKKYTIAIPYNKGGYQVLRHDEIRDAGKKV